MRRAARFPGRPFNVRRLEKRSPVWGPTGTTAALILARRHDREITAFFGGSTSEGHRPEAGVRVIDVGLHEETRVSATEIRCADGSNE